MKECPVCGTSFEVNEEHRCHRPVEVASETIERDILDLLITTIEPYTR